MIDGCKGTFWKRDLQILVLKHAKSLGTGDFMDQMQGHKNLVLTGIQLPYYMIIPDFLVKIFSHDYSASYKGPAILA